jgi:hypothetical protein
MNKLRKKSGKLSICDSLNKNLTITLMKEVNVFYNGNYKSLEKEIEENAENGKTFHVHGLAELIS